ncbi:MAG: hypothetical protein NTW87_18465, partial [Planctomycetota bacterium]|nr:hypothetical protein [Planctomycetota bacterium]
MQRRAALLALLLCGFASVAPAAETAARDDIFNAVRAALQDAGKTGRAVSFPYAVGSAKVDARIVSMNDAEMGISLQGGQSSLKLARFADGEVYALGAAVVPESVAKHKLLALFCANAKLDEPLTKELAKLEELGQPLTSLAGGLAEQAKQRQTEAREKQAAQAFERLQPMLRKEGMEKEAAGQLRGFMKQYAETELARSRQEEWTALLESL